MICIIDYGMGNLRSVEKAFHRINVEAEITNDPFVISKADKIVLPGVGHFKKGMENIKKLDLLNVLQDKVIDQKTPILGICLGMQLFTSFSEEGDCAGLNWIEAQTVKFIQPEHKFKVPHIGWNTLEISQKHKVFDDLNSEESFYFVHSYHVVCAHQENILTKTEYGIGFQSSIVKDNIVGVQFHPEKSHDQGLKLLSNFVNHC